MISTERSKRSNVPCRLRTVSDVSASDAVRWRTAQLSITLETGLDENMDIAFMRGILYAASGFIAGLCIYALVRHTSHLARYFFFAAVCAFLYTFGYASELGAASFEEIRFWLKFEYAGLSFISALWFLLSWKLYYRRSPHFRMIAMVMLLPAVTCFLVMTQEYHSLYYHSLDVLKSDTQMLVIIEKGFWYWVQLAYQLTFLGLSLFLQIRTWRNRGYGIKESSFWIWLGTAQLFPWNFAYQLGLSPYGIDLNPFGIAVSMLFIGYGIFRYRTLNTEEVLVYTIFSSLENPMVILDRFGNISDFNTAAQSIFPWLNPTVIGKPVPPSSSDAELFSPSNGRKLEKNVMMADGMHLFEGHADPLYQGKSIQGRIYFFRDVTESRRLLVRLRRLAYFDMLTGLYNRRRFMWHAERLIGARSLRDQPVAILMMDIDHFKTVNDRFGHAVGDRVLQVLGKVIRNRVSGHGIAGRYGGEEFTVILPRQDRAEALDFAEKLRKSIAGIAFERHLVPVRITVSIGISVRRPGEGGDLDALLVEADRALYEAKRKGRNRVEG